jgi:hypothetical protein
MKILFLSVVMAIVIAGCTRPPAEAPSSRSVTRKKASVSFPAFPSIDSVVYNNMQQTCAEYWDLDNMKMDTFTVRPEGDEFLVECDGIVEGELYHCVIRANFVGKAINTGRTKTIPNNP